MPTRGSAGATGSGELRVLEAGHVLAVPLAGALLGALGARVTKLEDLGRIDMYRRNGPYIDQEPGLDRTAYFAFANHSKTNAVLTVEEEPDRLAALLDDADVFLENLGAKRARTLGVAASVALDAHPGVLAISSTGFGQDGPYASYRAYAYNMHAAAALGYLTRNSDGEPADIDLAWGDLVSAYAVATIVAAWAVGPAGNRGAGLDYAMADAIVSHFPEFLAAACLDPASDAAVDRANEVSPYAPSGVYPASDGWVAITVDGDAQFEALAEVLDAALLRSPQFATADARFEHRVELDALDRRGRRAMGARRPRPGAARRRGARGTARCRPHADRRRAPRRPGILPRGGAPALGPASSDRSAVAAVRGRARSARSATHALRPCSPG